MHRPVPRGQLPHVPDATICLRLILADLLAPDVVEEVVQAADREYIAREIDRLQFATDRIVAFLDGVQGEPRN